MSILRSLTGGRTPYSGAGLEDSEELPSHSIGEDHLYVVTLISNDAGLLEGWHLHFRGTLFQEPRAQLSVSVGFCAAVQLDQSVTLQADNKRPYPPKAMRGGGGSRAHLCWQRRSPPIHLSARHSRNSHSIVSLQKRNMPSLVNAIYLLCCVCL